MSRLLAVLKGFARARRGNVTMIFALSAVPMLFAVGMGVDYTSAARRRDKLNAVSDAAALAAVTPAMMQQSSATAQSVAVKMFNGQAAALGGVTLAAGSPNIQVQDTPGLTGTVRTVTVSYSAASTNFFPAVLQAPTIAISGTSSSKGATQPNVNFYLMLDTSPSMAIPATQDGINTMTANTPTQNNGNGCAFACHEANPASDGLGNPGGEDNYALARNLGVMLRIDLVKQAVQNLTTTATQTSQATNAVYGMSITDFDNVTHLISSMNTNMSQVQQAANNIQMLTVWNNGGYLTQNNWNNDQDTDWDSAIATMNNTMGFPGGGTNNFWDRPQEVLFIVTDGVTDESLNNSRTIKAMGGTTCQVIKSRGIKIAVLYTTYNPLPTNPFYVSNVAPFQPNIANTLTNCASPNLFFQVNTGGDISAAMSALFQTAVGVAHLTH